MYDTKLSPLYIVNKARMVSCCTLSSTIESILRISVTELSKRYNMEPHNALFDAILCFELFRGTDNKDAMGVNPANVLKYHRE